MTFDHYFQVVDTALLINGPSIKLITKRSFCILQKYRIKRRTIDQNTNKTRDSVLYFN